MRSAVKFCLELCHTCEKKSSIAAYSVKLCIHTQDSTATTGHTTHSTNTHENQLHECHLCIRCVCMWAAMGIDKWLIL